MTELRNITGQIDDNVYLGDVMSVPSEYSKAKLKYLKEACKDALGLFDHSKITKPFLCDMGIYLSQKEMNDEYISNIVDNKPFWIIDAGYKNDFTCKMWEYDRFQ
jgi:hypothetical protein